MSSGSSRTPPPTPVIPIRVPTTKPIRILSSDFHVCVRGCPFQRSKLHTLCGLVVGADEAFAFEVQDDLLRGFFWCQFGGIDDNFGVLGLLVRIRDTSELLKDAGAGLGVQTFTVALFAGFNRRGNVDKNEPAKGSIISRTCLRVAS